MLVADEYVGHRDDDAVADRLAGTDPVRVVLSDTDRRRSRVRTTTVDGRDLGVVVARDLADGDLLETEEGTLVVVELEGVETLVLDVGSTELSPTAALELGHALGNRHWKLAVRGDEALFPVASSRERTEAVVGDVVPEAVSHRYETVPPTTFDDGPEHGLGVDHAHPAGSEHAHTHGAGTHTHDVHPVTGDEE